MLTKAHRLFLLILIGISNTFLWCPPENTSEPNPWQASLLDRLQELQRQRTRQPTIPINQETQTDAPEQTDTPTPTEIDSTPQENQKANVNTSQPFHDPFAHPGESVKVGLACLGVGRVVRAVPIEELPVNQTTKTNIKTVQDKIADTCDAGAEVLIANGAIGATTSFSGKTYAANHALLVLLSKQIAAKVKDTPLETVGKYIPGSVLRTAGATTLTFLELLALQKLGLISPAT